MMYPLGSRRQLGGLGSGGGTPAPTVTRLLDDQFTDTVAAGSVDGTGATPGPGTRNVRADTGNKLSITGGRMVFAGTASAGDDPRMDYGTCTRAAGLALAFDLFLVDLGNAFIFGFETGTGTGTARWQAAVYINTDIRFYKAATVATLSTDITTSTLRKFIIVLRSSGCYVFQAAADLLSYKLIWVEAALNTSTLYVGGASFAASSYSVDNVILGQLGGAFETDYGYASASLAGARSAGDTFTHAANSVIEFTLTTRPSSGQSEVWFRSNTVGTDGLRVTVDSSGNIDLDRVESGSATQIATGTGGATGQRYVIQAIGQTIRVWADNTLKINASSVSQFETATGGELEVLGTGGAVSNIYAYPVTPSGESKQWLDALCFG